MRYWWVNQNQTFRQEIAGGYLWSPKRNKNGHRNPFYEFMRKPPPGVTVFSFFVTRIGTPILFINLCVKPLPEISYFRSSIPGLQRLVWSVATVVKARSRRN